MKNASLPPIRVEPAVRELLESVLREGESLTQFIETAARKEAEWRQVEAAFAVRGDAELEDFRKNGNGGQTIEDVMGELRERGKQAKNRLLAEKARRPAGA